MNPKELMASDPTIKEVIIDYGEPGVMWCMCGPDLFLGFAQCERCKAISPDEYCAKYIVHSITRQQEPTVTIVR